LIAAAGTGGHIYPAIALADFLREKGIDVFFITSDRGEGEIVRNHGYKCKEFPYRGFYRRFTLENFRRSIKICLVTCKCFSLIGELKPRVVIGMGGYGQVPAVLSAKLYGIPVLIHEQDVKPGLSTRFLSFLADRITLSYEDTLSFLPRCVRKKCQVTGNPVRKSIISVVPGGFKSRWGFQGDKKVLLAFGGSLGAKSINDVVIDLISKKKEWERTLKNWAILLITGRRDFLRVKKRVLEIGFNSIVVLPYLEGMEKAYGAADLVLARSGASTVAELEALGIPAILVPYPYSTGNHQRYNAELLQRKGQAIVIEDSELTSERILEVLKMDLLRKSSMRKDATQSVAKVVLELARS